MIRRKGSERRGSDFLQEGSGAGTGDVMLNPMYGSLDLIGGFSRAVR